MIPKTLPRSLLTAFTAALVFISGCGGGGGGGEGYEPPGGSSGTPGTPGTPGVTPPVSSSTYVRNFGSRGSDEPVSMAALSDGGLAIHGRFDGESWLGVLDASGAAVSELDVVTQEEALGYRFYDSAPVEDGGAVFGGIVERTGTGSDIVVRYRNHGGGVIWERVLDAGAWSGSVNADDGIVDDDLPRVHAVTDSNGAWLGTWVTARSRATLPYTDAEGARRLTSRHSATLWFIDTRGNQVSRTRLVNARAPAASSVLLVSSAVLDTGSLAVLLGEYSTPDAPNVDRLVVRRVGRDGTIGGPEVDIPSGMGTELFSVPGALLLVGGRSVARVDISAQSILWRTNLHLSQTSYQTGAMTRVDRNQRAELYLAGVASASESMLVGMNLDTGVEFGACSFPNEERLISLRGRDSGNLRALILGPDLVLRSANLAWNCSTIEGTVQEHGPVFSTVDSWETGLGYFKSGALSFQGDGVFKLGRTRVARTNLSGVQEFDVSAMERLDVRYHSVVSAQDAQFALLGDEVSQRRSNTGSLVRADGLPGIWSAAYDEAGRLWASGLPANFDTSDRQCQGLVVVSANNSAECLHVPGRDLRGWQVVRGSGSGIWAFDPEHGRSIEVLNFPGDNTAVAYAGRCAFALLDVANGRVRAGAQPSRDGSGVCRESDTQGWRVALNSSAFGGALNIDNLHTLVVPASDGGAAVVFGVRQMGAVPGLRSNANITGDADIAMLKLDAAGNPRWMRVYGAARDEYAYELLRMADGGYAISGTSDSLDAVTPGSQDILVVRTGPDGFVGRTGEGSDACQACLGSITGASLREIVSAAETYAVTRAAPVTLTSTPVTLNNVVPVTLPLRGETNGRSCIGNVTDVQEAAAGGTTPGGSTGESPVARFDVLAQYGGAGASPIANRDPARFDGRASTPNTIQRWQWDFEDDGVFDAEGVAQIHTYGTRGPKVARLRVTTASGATAEMVREFTVAAAPDYYVRVTPVHATGVPGNRIERVGGGINCVNQADGAVNGACFANGSNAPGFETVLRATPAEGSGLTRWVGCDLTRAQAEGPPLCVISNDLDGRERQVEAHFAVN